MADDVVRDPPGAIGRHLTRYTLGATEHPHQETTFIVYDAEDVSVPLDDGTAIYLADDVDTALRACADDLETAPSPQKIEETNDDLSRVPVGDSSISSSPPRNPQRADSQQGDAMMQAVIIPAKTVVHIGGIPAYLAVETIVETAFENMKLLTGYSYAALPEAPAAPDCPPSDAPVLP